MNRYTITYTFTYNSNLELFKDNSHQDSVVVTAENIAHAFRLADSSVELDIKQKRELGFKISNIVIVSVVLTGSTSPIINPQLQSIPELASVIRIFENIHQEIEDGTYHEDNDNTQYIYEEIASALYGPNYFKWLNGNT